MVDLIHIVEEFWNFPYDNQCFQKRLTFFETLSVCKSVNQHRTHLTHVPPLALDGTASHRSCHQMWRFNHTVE